MDGYRFETASENGASGGSALVYGEGGTDTPNLKRLRVEQIPQI
jgi:hypothetical protein